MNEAEEKRWHAAEARIAKLAAAPEHHAQMQELKGIPNAERVIKRMCVNSPFLMERFGDAIAEQRAPTWVRAQMVREAPAERRRAAAQSAATETAADAAIARMDAATISGLARVTPQATNGASTWDLYRHVAQPSAISWLAPAVHRPPPTHSPHPFI